MKDTAPELRRALASDDADERATAAIQLGQRGDDSARPALQALFGDPSPMVALAAGYACARLGDPLEPELLARALSADDETTRQFTSELVVALGDDVVEPLKHILAGPSEAAESALLALDDIHTKRAQRVVSEARLEGSPFARLQAELLEEWDEEDDEDDDSA